MNDVEGLGVRLKEVRKRNNLTLREVAKDIDTDFSYLSKVENGATPSLQFLNLLANYYKADLNFLLTGREEVKDEWIDLSRELKKKGLSPDDVMLIMESFYTIKNVVNKLK